MGHPRRILRKEVKKQASHVKVATLENSGLPRNLGWHTTNDQCPIVVPSVDSVIFLFKRNIVNIV